MERIKLRSEINKYGGDMQFTAKQRDMVLEMLEEREMKKEINTQMGAIRDLSIISDKMSVIADEIYETIPLLPSINFEQCQDFKGYNLSSGVPITDFLFKFNFYPYQEFGMLDDLREYDNIIRLVISNKSGFWSDSNTVILRINDVKSVSDGLGWSFTITITKTSNIGKLLHTQTLTISDYDYICFTVSSIINYESLENSGTDITGTNLFSLKKYSIQFSLNEEVMISLSHIDVGIGNSENAIKSIKLNEIKPSIKTLFRKTFNEDIEDFYTSENQQYLENEFLNNFELAFNYIEEYNVGRSLYDVGNFDDWYEKLNKMLEYESFQYSSTVYKAISATAISKQIQTLDENDFTLEAVLLRNDEIIFDRISGIPVLKPKGILFDSTHHSGEKLEDNLITEVSYTLSYDDTWTDVPVRVVRSNLLNPTYNATETINAEFEPAQLEKTNLHVIFEDDDTILLGEVVITPSALESGSGSLSTQGPIEVMNIDTTRKTAQYTLRAPCKIGVNGVKMQMYVVNLTKLFVLPKGAIGFGYVARNQLEFILGYGGNRKTFPLSSFPYSMAFVEFRGEMYYGYAYVLSSISVTTKSSSDVYIDLQNISTYYEDLQLTSKDNDVLVYGDMTGLERYGVKVKVGYRSATGTFSSASRVDVTFENSIQQYLSIYDDIFVYDTANVKTSVKIRDVLGAKIDRCGHHGFWIGISGLYEYTSQFRADGDMSQTIITSDYALANNAVIQQLLLDLETLQDDFESLKVRVDYIEDTFRQMNERGPFLLQMLDMVMSFAGPISIAFDMGKSAKHFIKDVVYQNKMNRLTLGQMKTPKTLEDKNFNLSLNQNRNLYVDGHLNRLGKTRSDIYQNNNDRPYFLNGGENVSSLDLAEKLDLMAAIRTGGLKRLDDLDNHSIGLVNNTNDVMKGLHPTFNVWARPLETLPKPVRGSAFKIGTKFAKLRRGNMDKAFSTNTRLPFHTAGSFDDYKCVAGKPVRIRRWIGVGEPNTKNQSVNDKGAGIGGFKYESQLIGVTSDNKLLWKHKPYDSTQLSPEALDSLYLTCFKKKGVGLTNQEKYDKIIRHTENRIGTSKLLYSYLPDSSFSEALDLFTNKVDLKYNLLSQNCQTLMLNLLNYSQSGQELKSLTPDTQAALIRARLQSIENFIQLFVF